MVWHLSKYNAIWACIATVEDPKNGKLTISKSAAATKFSMISHNFKVEHLDKELREDAI